MGGPGYRADMKILTAKIQSGKILTCENFQLYSSYLDLVNTALKTESQSFCYSHHSIVLEESFLHFCLLVI